MGYVPLRLDRKVRRHSKRANAASCLLSTAWKQQYGVDEASTTDHGSTVTQNGQQYLYGHTLGSWFTMAAWDLHLPFGQSQVKMRRLGTRRQVAAKRTALGTAGVGTALAVLSGLWWIPVLVIALLVMAVLGLASWRSGKSGLGAGTPVPGHQPSLFQQRRAAHTAPLQRASAATSATFTPSPRPLRATTGLPASPPAPLRRPEPQRPRPLSPPAPQQLPAGREPARFLPAPPDPVPYLGRLPAPPIERTPEPEPEPAEEMA